MSFLLVLQFNFVMHIGVDIPRKLCVYTASCFYLGYIDACEDGTFCSTSNLPQGQCIEKVTNGPISTPANCITTNNWGCGAPGTAACCNPAVKCIDRMCRLSSNGCSYDGYYSNPGSQQPVLKPTMLVLTPPTMIPSVTSKLFRSTSPTFSPSQKRSDALSSMPIAKITLPSASPTSTNSPTTIVQRSSVPTILGFGTIPRRLCVYTTSCFYLGYIDACEDGTFCSTSNLPQGQCIEKVSNGPLSPPSNCITTNNWGCGVPGTAACCNPAVKCIDRMCRLSSNGCSYEGFDCDASNPGSQPVLKPTTLVLTPPSVVPITACPSRLPVSPPSVDPICTPTTIPKGTRSYIPSVFPTITPSQKRSDERSSAMPTTEYTIAPSAFPSPSRFPSSLSSNPSRAMASQQPSLSSTTVFPSTLPSFIPRATPTTAAAALSKPPTLSPSPPPTVKLVPSFNPSALPTSTCPTTVMSRSPSRCSSTQPSVLPTQAVLTTQSYSPVVTTTFPSIGPTDLMKVCADPPKQDPSVWCPSSIPTPMPQNYTCTVDPTLPQYRCANCTACGLRNSSFVAVIPMGATQISDYAFSYCPYMAYVVIPT